MASSQRRPEHIRAEQALKRAMDGKLPVGGSYSLQKRHVYETTLPMRFCKNLGLEQGDEGTAYIDYENECIILDYSEVE
jgi:hypothetical protein